MAAFERPVSAGLPPSSPTRPGRSAAPSSEAAAPWSTAPSWTMTSLIEQFGPLGVFVLMVPESACIPVPSELTLLFSGFAVGQHWMSFPLAVAAATAGNVVGSLIAYGLGATDVLSRMPGTRILLGPSEQLLDRHGMRAVFIARLLPLARTFVSLPAGAQHLPLVRFTLLTTIGCAVWATLFVAIGALSGTAWSVADSVLGKALLVVGLAIVLAALLRRARAR